MQQTCIFRSYFDSPSPTRGDRLCIRREANSKSNVPLTSRIVVASRWIGKLFFASLDNLLSSCLNVSYMMIALVVVLLCEAGNMRYVGCGAIRYHIRTSNMTVKTPAVNRWATQHTCTCLKAANNKFKLLCFTVAILQPKCREATRKF